MIAKIGKMALRLVFTVAYTATILPFTTNFFTQIANAAVKSSHMFSIPLQAAHFMMLPVFLAALEYISIDLACAFWKADLMKRSTILFMLLACQSFAVTSVYVDIRSGDYLKEGKGKEQANAAIEESIKNQRESIKNKVALVAAEIRDARSERDANSSIRQLLASTNKANREIVKEEMQNREWLRNKRQQEFEVLQKRKVDLEEALKQKESELEVFVTTQNTTKPKSAVDYLANEWFSNASMLAGFISLLFPLTIISAGFVLSGKAPAANENLPLFNLHEHLKKAASLPADAHLNFVKSLVPSLDAYLSAFQASQTVVNCTDSMHLDHALVRKIIDEIKNFQTQIASSKIDENAKSFLISALNKILNQKIVKEEPAHV